MSFVVAYSFRSDMALSEVLDTMRANTTWEWWERDSEFWGDYISAQSTSQPVMVKIFIEGDGYLLELKFLDDNLRTAWEPVAEGIINDLLPSLSATDVQPAEPNN